MERRRLGATDIELSVIGLGTWVFGGRWGGADDADSLAACHAAIDAGVNWIDTADIYGQGRAERIVGQAVRERRDEVIVATKGGVAWETGPPLRIWREASADYLRMACDRSLEALGLDHIDLYQVHWPVAGVAAEETIGALEELREAGKVRAIGVSNYGLADLEATGAVARIDSFQPGYHLMRRDIEGGELRLVPRARRRRDRLRPARPRPADRARCPPETTFAAGDWRAESELFADDAFPERIAVVGELDELAREAGREGGVAELAVAWVLRRPEVTSAIVGARSAEQAAAQRRPGRRAAVGRRGGRRSRRSSPATPTRRGHYGHGEPPNPSADA